MTHSAEPFRGRNAPGIPNCHRNLPSANAPSASAIGVLSKLLEIFGETLPPRKPRPKKIPPPPKRSLVSKQRRGRRLFPLGRLRFATRIRALLEPRRSFPHLPAPVQGHPRRNIFAVPKLWHAPAGYYFPREGSNPARC